MKITNETADMMMDFATYIYTQLTKGNVSEDETRDFVTDAFLSFCNFAGIEEVEEENEDEIYDDVDEIGYNPYIGGYDYDC